MVAGDDKRLVLGKIVGLYGVDGWVKLESYSDPRTRIFQYSPWYVGPSDSAVEFVKVQGRAQGKGIVARLPGVANRDAAAALIGHEIRIARSALPPPKRGEYYWTDLEGLAVVNHDGVAFGQVSHLFSTGANDVLVVRDGDRERLIPFVFEQFVTEVDIGAGRMVVDWDKDF